MNEKLDALKVYCMWSWLERNPTQYKLDYPLFVELGFGKSKTHCPWCVRWIRDLRSSKCGNPDSECPLYRAGECCLDTGSLYDVWYYNEDSGKRSRAAGEIARIAWQEYKRLGG